MTTQPTVELAGPYGEDWIPPPSAVRWALYTLRRLPQDAWLQLPERDKPLAQYEVDHGNRRLVMRSRSVDVAAVETLHRHMVIVFGIAGYAVHKELPC